jgi:ornithine cyclodeaminase
MVVDAIALNDIDAVASALSTADVVAATTNTTRPLWNDNNDTTIKLKKGCLITSIGSYTPEMQEIPEYVVNSSTVIIDTPEAIAVGDLKHLGESLEEAAAKRPIFLAGHALLDSKSVLERHKSSENDFIFYKAVGTAIQDVLTAQVVFDKAKEKGIGQEVDMS